MRDEKKKKKKNSSLIPNYYYYYYYFWILSYGILSMIIGLLAVILMSLEIGLYWVFSIEVSKFIFRWEPCK